MTKPKSQIKEMNQVDEMAHQNLLQIIQRVTDEHWYSDYLEDDFNPLCLKSAKVVDSKRAKIMRDTRNLENFMGFVTGTILKENRNYPMDEPMPNWTPRENLPTRRVTDQFMADQLGTSLESFRELRRGRPFKWSEVIGLSVVTGIDIIQFAMPTLDRLEVDADIELPIGDPDNRYVYGHQYVLWLRGLAPLPRQDANIYYSELCLPSLAKGTAVSAREGYERPKKEFARRLAAKSGVCKEFKTVDPQFHSSDPTLPFGSGYKAQDYSTSKGVEVTFRVNLHAAYIRHMISAALSKGNQKSLRSTFKVRASQVQRNMASIVNLLSQR